MDGDRLYMGSQQGAYDTEPFAVMRGTHRLILRLVMEETSPSWPIHRQRWSVSTPTPQVPGKRWKGEIHQLWEHSRVREGPGDKRETDKTDTP